MSEQPDDVSPEQLDDALSEAERDLLTQALLGSTPRLDAQLWSQLLARATDPDAPDPGVELVTGDLAADPFDVALADPAVDGDPEPSASPDDGSAVDAVAQDDSPVWVESDREETGLSDHGWQPMDMADHRDDDTSDGYDDHGGDSDGADW